MERELAVKPLLQRFASVLLEVAVRVPGKLSLFMFSKIIAQSYLRTKTKMSEQRKTWNL